MHIRYFQSHAVDVDHRPDPRRRRCRRMDRQAQKHGHPRRHSRRGTRTHRLDHFDLPSGAQTATDLSRLQTRRRSQRCALQILRGETDFNYVRRSFAVHNLRRHSTAHRKCAVRRRYRDVASANTPYAKNKRAFFGYFLCTGKESDSLAEASESFGFRRDGEQARAECYIIHVLERDSHVPIFS